jgi:hypothetical protein
MAWRLAKSLIKLRDQINVAAPHRSKVSDGSIGDTSHSSRVSDHNPDRNGVVAAIDVTHDPVNGCDGHTLSRAVISDPRVKYVIFNSEIWKARTGKWERYTGPNAHKHHVHISVKAEVYDNVEPWPLSVAQIPPPPVSRPVLKRGDRGPQVEVLQRRLRKELDVQVDGIFGAETERLLKVFQRIAGIEPDGIAGPAVFKALGL